MSKKHNFTSPQFGGHYIFYPVKTVSSNIIQVTRSTSQQIGSPPFWSTPTSHCRRAGLGGSRSCEWWISSGVKCGSSADVCAVPRSTYLQSGFFVVFPDSRHWLVSSGIISTQILWRLKKKLKLRKFIFFQFFMFFMWFLKYVVNLNSK
jgi:hypothetical protein